MPRLLTAVSLTTLMLSAAACGGGGGGDKPGKGDAAEPAAATPVAAASGLVTQRGSDWSFSRPDGWSKVRTTPEAGKESVVFQSAPGAQGIPSQVGIGAASKYKNPLKTAVRIARDINETRFPTYEIKDEGPLEVAGADGYKIDATYQSFTETKVPIRIVDVYVQTPGKRQMNFFVRGPASDLQELDVDRVIDSFRVLAGKGDSA